MRFLFFSSTLTVLLGLSLFETALADHHVVNQPQISSETVRAQATAAKVKQKQLEMLRQQSYTNAVTRANKKRAATTLPSVKTYNALKSLPVSKRSR